MRESLQPAAFVFPKKVPKYMRISMMACFMCF